MICFTQSQIESLSITTDCACDDVEFYPQGGLYELKRLKRLCWRAPRGGFIPDLSVMICNNAETLRYLEVDLVSWERAEHYARQGSSADDPSDPTRSYCFWRIPEGKISGPNYPVLQTLCLTEVALPRDAVGVFDIGVLQTLRLRNCGGWDVFLKDIVRLCLPIGLKTLEILAKPGMLTCDADEVLSKFLAAFNGLEELYVCLQGPLPTNLVWPGVINHRATLKRFVHHLRMVDLDSEFNQEIDEADLGLNVGDAFLESLDKIQLEAMGLSIGPQDMVSSSKADWCPR